MLHETGDATADEMVLAFLQEIDSPDYANLYADALKAVHCDRSSLIDNADLNNVYANCARTVVLSLARGYGRNEYLFHGFPTDVIWRRVEFDPAEFHRLRHIGNEKFWHKLTGGTRLIEDSARNYKGTQIEPTVNNIVEALRRDESIPHIILVDDNYGRLVVLEGNRRVTACAIAKPDKVFALVGKSPTMDKWYFI